MDIQINHKDVVQFCKSILDTFDPVTQAHDQHLDESLSEIVKYRGLDDNTETFIIQVFTGCVKFDNVLNVVMDTFFVKDGKHVLRSEANLYKVICYLALFRLSEIGMAHFRRFVRSQNVSKMYRFLNFFLDHKNMQTWMTDEWSRCYESSFVQTTLLSPITVWLPELEDLLSQLKDKIDNKPMKREHMATTAVKPFKITQPRPRSIPMPEPIPKLEKFRPVPKSIFKSPRDMAIISQQKDLNRQMAEDRLMQASRLQFACANPEKSVKTQRKIQTIIAEEERKLSFDSHKSQPAPIDMLEHNVPVKLNAATILREAKLYQKREDEQIKKLEGLQAGERDASEFLKWQSKMRQADIDSQLADIERRKLEGKLSLEDAILARANVIQNNREKVAEMKYKAEQIMHDYLEKRLKQEKVMRELVEAVGNSHLDAKEAKVKLQHYKARIVQEVNAESQALMRDALERAEEEMRQKMVLIQQIRAMEASPASRQKLVDLTENAGYGFLSEMSIAELKEQIQFLKIKHINEEEDRRDEILATKQAKNEMLMSNLETISRHRKEMSKVAALKLENKKKSRNDKPELRDEHLTDLERKLEERRALRMKGQDKARVVLSRKPSARTKVYMHSNKTLEEHNWAEIERGQERTARLISGGLKKDTAPLSKPAATKQGLIAAL